ncbi:MarR family winged helix-turn-helix transcriptional regulator [Shewanella mangrovi]|uniref:MarR family winged helix-turn-helix transcriptional regulator n=1 Tax=Shewanella mangrovi TaxID=1515746 RepID=UPI00068F496E|nr:MarR family transcriptional regulator [Shewanella mangrovi]
MEQEVSGYLMADILRMLNLTFQTHEKVAGLSIAQALVVKRVEMCPGIRQFDLAERLSMQPIRISRIVDSLEKQGLVERRKPDNDQRVRRLYVTEKARDILDNIDATVLEIWIPAWAGINEADATIFRKVLGQMQQNLAANNTRFSK